MRRVLGSLAILMGLAGSVRADVIDQSYIPVTGQGYNTSVSSNLPIGQEFTPTLNGLDFVDLYIGDAQVGAGPGANFQVNIRSGGILGVILATSNLSFVANDTNLGVGLYSNFIVTRFTFGSQVSLTPGSTHVIEVVQQTPTPVGSGNFIVYGGPAGTSAYAGGQAIVGGVAQTGFDFAFREGVRTAAIPEPSPMILAGALGVLGGLVRLCRRGRQAR